MSFPRYPESKDSRIGFLGKIPIHWALKRLKHCAEVFPSNVDKKSVEGQVPVKLCNYTDVYYNDIIDAELNFMSATATKEQIRRFELQQGDVVFTKDSESADDIGVAALVPQSIPRVIYGYHLSIARPQDFVSGNFLKRFFDSKETKAYFETSANGLTRVGLGQYAVDNAPIALPSLGEQIQIARFLDHETAKIDALIREQERLIELLQEKRQAVISHAVTKGLDPDVPMKDSGVEWLGEVPAHWIIARIKNFARIESGHTPDKKKEEYWVDCDIPWVSLNDSKQLKKADYIADTSTKVNDLGIANSSARLLPAEAVVFTRDASIGLSAITTKPMAVSQHLIAWLCAGEKLVPEYLLLIFYAMESEFERYTFGATIKTIGMDDVRSLTAAFPPMEEQKQLVAWAFRKKETLRAGLDAAEKTTLLLKERRSALISAAVTGKIDVRNWQPPTDESAFDEEVDTVGMEATA